ncbi:hypothetical protein CAPTEDRAFT_196111 [Capitella teleta]|uniref:Uncharacterized protein n=1 Tax=Capitella teleta TaxID=283909 RepID=R7VLB5_CAPTE|nr:hypothetical protein CAPTEDRAFT_196111 [Capitella teleta]|eukprot:ELU18111.1 hypothetical protein CAPTEDRAFT_196111 [Capitella teleta]
MTTTAWMILGYMNWTLSKIEESWSTQCHAWGLAHPSTTCAPITLIRGWMSHDQTRSLRGRLHRRLLEMLDKQLGTATVPCQISERRTVLHVRSGPSKSAVGKGETTSSSGADRFTPPSHPS